MSADIGSLPAPKHLDTRDLPTQEIADSFMRIHQCRYSALYFGKTSVYRFDAPHGEYGVLYMADYLAGRLSRRSVTYGMCRRTTIWCLSVGSPAGVSLRYDLPALLQCAI